MVQACLSLCSAYFSRLPFSINEIPENPAAIGNWNILIFSDRSDRTFCDSSHFWIHRRLRGQCFLAADPLVGGFKPSQRVADRHPKVGSFSLKCWSHRQPLRCLRFLPLLLFQSHPEKKKTTVGLRTKQEITWLLSRPPSVSRVWTSYLRGEAHP